MKYNQKIALIFDNDVDGILSAVILLKSKNLSNIDLFPSSITELAVRIKSLTPQYKRIIVVDIGINPKESRLFDVLDKHIKFGTQIQWFDTHPSTLEALSKRELSIIFCYKHSGATATLIQNLFGTKKTIYYQKMAAIIDKEVKVPRTNKLLKDANTLGSALLNLTEDHHYIELINKILSNSDDNISKIPLVKELSEKGQKRADAARSWLYRTLPFKGKPEIGPAIWRTKDETFFKNVSGKALRTSAKKRNGICVLILPNKNYPKHYRFKVQVPDTDKVNRQTPIMNIAESLGGFGGGHKGAFGGFIPKDQVDEFINKVWKYILMCYKMNKN